MKYYFKLQYNRLERWLREMGINPTIGLLLGVVFFILSSKYLFYKTEYASWIYLIVTTTLIFRLSDRKRNDNLDSIFPSQDYFVLRLIENGLYALPFISFLLFEKDFLTVLILIPIVGLIVFLKTNQYLNKTLPTPFKKFPYEFIVGFRKTFWLVIISYFLIIKSIQVENYNLGLFGLVLIFAVSMFYYQKPEPEFFVWIHSCRASEFLKAKVLNSIICISILSFLGLVGMIMGFSSNWLTTIFVYLAGYIVLGSIIVAKYSAYPHEMNIAQGVLYALSLMFPPMLLITIWLFYTQSIKRLQPILE